jgi:hypothetical protein
MSATSMKNTETWIEPEPSKKVDQAIKDNRDPTIDVK